MEPLTWNATNLSRWQSFIIGTPFICPIDKEINRLNKIIKQRNRNEVKSLWHVHDQSIQKHYQIASDYVYSNGPWHAPNFIPNDPTTIVFAMHLDYTDKYDLLPMWTEMLKDRFHIDWLQLDSEGLAETNLLEALRMINGAVAQQDVQENRSR
jgi:hypothetical protein